MNEPLLLALLPLGGVLLGASVQYFFSRSAESQKQYRLLRSAAYSDYLRAVAKLACTAAKDRTKQMEGFAEAADAKARIAIYGAAGVINKLAAFEKVGATINSEVAIKTFLELCEEMRKESPGAGKVADSEVRWVLFGPAQYPKLESAQQGAPSDAQKATAF